MKRFLIISIFIFSALFSFFTGKLLATNAIPDPVVPCTEKDYEDPEFNSLRPYQASPCKSAPFATMCSNSLTVTLDSIHTRCTSLDKDGNCPYFGRVETRRVVIGLDGVKLPILGNTQDVVNSKNPNDSIDEAQKVNEYASWYLAGSNQKAEYGADLPEETLNFSGPAKKLLPASIQEYNRFKSLWNAGVVQEFTESEDNPEGYFDEDKDKVGIQTKETENHNQIVLCTTKNVFGIKNPWIGVEQPIPCYDGGIQANGKVYRLKDWWDSKKTGLAESIKVINGWDGSTRWDFHVPPFPWQFEKEIYYQKAYNEWQGKECKILFGKLLCVDLRIPGVIDVHSNRWADFYQYIPLSNTVDRRGKEDYGGATISASGGTVMAIAESNINPLGIPQLFFPHTTEVAEATTNLNKTFVPKKGVTIGTIPQNTEDNTSTCQILDVRTNSGDDLTFGNTSSKHKIDFTATYQVSSVGGCHEVERHTNATPAPYPTPIPPPVFDCNATITASVDLTTVAPELDSIWKSTTAGEASTFRKIFPKVEPGAPVSCVADIPGVSPVNYGLVFGNNGTSPGVTNLVVKNPPSSTATSPEIYFPHLGSVYEYFLKGIQTALRPQGYGEPITDGTQCVTTLACGELPDTLPKASGSCALGSISSRVGTIPQSLKDIVNAAAETYKVPPNLILGIMYGEGLFNPGRFQWNDTNVKNWATCQKVPGCSETGADNFVGFYSSDWVNVSKNIQADIKKLDPARLKPDMCNLLDSIYGLAWNLHNSAAGGGSLPPTCYGISLKSSIPSSCSWGPEQYESAIKVSESGYTSACLTKPGSCATGGGLDAACPNGDHCETVGTLGNTSHNACVWDVSHGK